MRSLLTAAAPLLALALSAAPAGRAQVKVPTPPDTYDVVIRYRIIADRNERVLQYEAMAKFFAGLGFKETETDESQTAPFDPSAEVMYGTVPSKTARDLVRDRRVQTTLLTRPGYKAPEDPQTPMRVLIELTPNRDQLKLAKQTEAALDKLGFKRDKGFDTRKNTMLRGAIPAGNIPKLLRDLRYQPSGWLVPDLDPDRLATTIDGTLTPNLVKPFGDGVPVKVVEVLGPFEPPPAIITLPPIPADQPHLNKLTADLRRRLAAEGVKDQPMRLEVVLAIPPIENDREWRVPFARAGAEIEGRVGTVVSVQVAKGAQAGDLAALPDVTSVRLPRVASGTPPAPTPKKEEPKKEEPKKDEKEKLTRISSDTGPALGSKPKGETDPLKATRVDRLLASGKRGQGVRVVILDTDFAGWEDHLLPRKDGQRGPVHFIDLTAERNRDVRPDPMPGELGHGTHCALAVRLAAPAADLTLIRVPPDAPYHVVNVGRSVRGDQFRTEGLVTRRIEIEADLDDLHERQRTARAEYQRAFNDFSDEEPARQRRIAAQRALVKLGEEEKAILARLGRVEDLENDLAALRGADVVVSLLHWDTGFALDGASAVSRFLDDWLARTKAGGIRPLGRPGPTPPPLWFQPAGDTRGQSWTGLFRDADNNGVMEFAPPDEEFRPGRWSRELNFLAVRSDGKDVLDLPAGAKVRVSVQWREPHDATLSEADYRNPVAPLRLQLVKQRDPSGEKYATDEIDPIAVSEGLPARLHIEPNFGVYEHSLEVTLPADGRYAVRIEGRIPPTVRPADAPTLPGHEVVWELRPRVFVESADGQAAFRLADYASAEGGVAVPADARAVFAVGAAGPDGKPRPDSSAGAGPGTALAEKPDLLAPDTYPTLPEGPARGSDLAASFAAGVAAALQSAGLPRTSFPQRLDIPAGGLLVVPEAWLRR